jgi:CRISPR-associated RAMP protein (TIGR02581 family)
MFSRVFNELTLVVDLSPDRAPLLIKSGLEAGADPTLLDLNFVRSTDSHSGKRTVFLPGSSLKGTLRSYSERIARTVRPDGGPTWCCNPFANDSCGKRTEKDDSPASRYARACLACRTFGHTRLGSHVLISDAFPTGEVALEQRDGVAIDRVSGAVSAGPFNMEVATAGTFRATLSLRNFQLWQVGWLAITLRDLGAGLVPLGSGKSKGFGRMAVQYVSATVSYPGQMRPQSNGRDYAGQLYDVGAFGDLENYGMFESAARSAPFPPGGSLRDSGDLGRVAMTFDRPEAIEMLLGNTISAWRAMVESQWPGGAR